MPTEDRSNAAGRSATAISAQRPTLSPKRPFRCQSLFITHDAQRALRSGWIVIYCQPQAGRTQFRLSLLDAATFAPTAFGTREPTARFRRSEQASIAVAAVGMLAELARTIRRHRAGLQRQSRY